jgi:hypothetical protein
MSIFNGYSAMPMPDEQQIKDGAHILSEIIDDAAPLNERRYLFPAQQMLRYAAWLARTDSVQEGLARRLRAAYIVVTKSTMWPTDEQFLEMLTLMSKVGPVPGQDGLGDTEENEEAYDRGRRDMLNAILALNPEVARKLHDIRAEDGDEPFSNVLGQLPFDVVFWVCAVAEQLGIEPKEMSDDSCV